jgi:glucokinase
MQENELSIKAVNLFCKIYGAEASNLALKYLPYGGVYLAGGIAGKLLPSLQQGHFMEGFLAKGRYRELLQNIPVKVCLNNECALNGALAYAQKNL